MPDALSGLWPKNDDGVKLSEVDPIGWTKNRASLDGGAG